MWISEFRCSLPWCARWIRFSVRVPWFKNRLSVVGTHFFLLTAWIRTHLSLWSSTSPSLQYDDAALQFQALTFLPVMKATQSSFAFTVFVDPFEFWGPNDVFRLRQVSSRKLLTCDRIRSVFASLRHHCWLWCRLWWFGTGWWVCW